MQQPREPGERDRNGPSVTKVNSQGVVCDCYTLSFWYLDFYRGNTHPRPPVIFCDARPPTFGSRPISDLENQRVQEGQVLEGQVLSLTIVTIGMLASSLIKVHPPRLSARRRVRFCVTTICDRKTWPR